jgi:hypothetical protein
MSVKNTQNDINAEDYVVDLDGATEPYLTQPKRKYGEKTRDIIYQDFTTKK